MADLNNNMDLSRLKKITDKEKRLEKYKKSVCYIRRRKVEKNNEK